MSNTFVSGSVVNFAGSLAGFSHGLIQNNGPGVLHVDRASGVTATSGIRLESGECLCVMVEPDDGIYGINSNGDCYVRLLAGATYLGR